MSKHWKRRRRKPVEIRFSSIDHACVSSSQTEEKPTWDYPNLVAIAEELRMGVKISPLTGNSHYISEEEATMLLTSGQGLQIPCTGLEMAEMHAFINCPEKLTIVRDFDTVNKRRKTRISYTDVIADLKPTWIETSNLCCGKMRFPGKHGIMISEKDGCQNVLQLRWKSLDDLKAFCPLDETNLPDSTSVKLTKQMLGTAKLCGVMENSFLICSVGNPAGLTDAGEKLMLIIDQHALHERIRLDKLRRKELNCPDFGLKSIFLIPNMRVGMPLAALVGLSDFYLEFARLGLKVASMDLKHEVAVVSHVPNILADKYSQVADREAFRQGLSVFIREALEIFAHASRSVLILPAIIDNWMATAACRGAIMFGDVVAKHELQKLVEDAEACQFPFQCAHGRPSMIPVAINHLGDSCTIKTAARKSTNPVS